MLRFAPLVALVVAMLACVNRPTPTPRPTVTPGPMPTIAPTPDNLDLDEGIIIESDDPRLEGVEWKQVPNSDGSSKISFSPPDGGVIEMYQSNSWTVYWTFYMVDAAGDRMFVSNYGVEHVDGTSTDIKIGRGNGWSWATVQLQIGDDEIVVEHLIGRNWAMAFRRHDVNVWEAALVPNWP